MKKILVVGDQKANIALLRAQLSEFHVIEADSGGSALRKIREERPDLILLDAMMPGVGGFSFLSIIKNAEGTRFTPVIVITALNTDEERVKFLEKGADDYITKPFSPQVLLARINNLLQTKFFLQEQLDNIKEMVFQLVNTVEARDRFRVKHSKRTAFYAEKLAQKYYPLKIMRTHVRMAALLHDIGNIYIQESILLKPGRLDPEEIKMVRAHPEAGANICSYILPLRPVLPFIRHHHEHFDGSGYPDGLKGTEIPLGARILSVADAYDALTSDRPYRSAYSLEKALEIMRQGAGTQWDQRIIVQFCQMVETDQSVAEQQTLWYFEKQNMLKPGLNID
ncbi:MAG: response regulator [Firmicutes bacterium]|nr:response regulator [Bacillota bacterium]